MTSSAAQDVSLATVEVARQCAWCLLIVDASGVYSIPATRTIRAATYGICPTCKASVRAEFGACLSKRTRFVAA
jgi:hypothetical protein